MNPANPILSPDGQHVLSGFGDLYLDGEELLLFGRRLRGQYPGWLTDRVIAYLDPNGFLCEYRGPDIEPRRMFDVPFNRMACGGGKWIGTNTQQQVTYVSNGAGIVDSLTDTYAPAMASDGASWGCLTGNNDLVHQVLLNGVRVASGVIDDKLSLTATNAVWSLFVDGLQATYGWIAGRVERLQATWQRYEVDPGIAKTPSGETWIVSHDDTRTLVRPAGSTFGYVFPGCKTPHVMWNASTQRLRVVGDLEDRLLDASIDLSTPREDLSVQPVIEPLPVGTPIADTLPYVLGRADRWPRTGSHALDQIPVAGQNAVALMKFESPTFGEWWRWDDTHVYHHEDRSDGLNQPYHFSPDDRWVPRRWKVGDVLDCRQSNTLRRTADEGVTWSVRPWAYTMTLVAAFDAYPCGGDIGTAPVIVVEYDPTYSLEPRRGFAEFHWYARDKDVAAEEGWGWWRWQSFRLGQTPDLAPPKGQS